MQKKIKKNLDASYSNLATRILGIDPGYGRIGIAILEKEKLIHSECFETSATISHPERLALLSDKITEIIKKWQPYRLGLETLLFSKNVKTALKVAEARGVILATAAKNNLEIVEFNPNEIKVAVTGFGKADKKQVISMIQKIYKINKKIKHDDEYDAIAIAITASVVHTNNKNIFAK
jgi:crossover junction endodeoxyribonuclease RuvC